MPAEPRRVSWDVPWCTDGVARNTEDMLRHDRIMRCKAHGAVTHRWWPSPEAAPFWRCSECGEPYEGAAALPESGNIPDSNRE
jgi:hypothetical protein